MLISVGFLLVFWYIFSQLLGICERGFFFLLINFLFHSIRCLFLCVKIVDFFDVFLLKNLNVIEMGELVLANLQRGFEKISVGFMIIYIALGFMVCIM